MKAKVSIMKIISIGLLVILLIWLLSTAGQVEFFADPASLLVVLFIPLTMIIFSNVWTDFTRAIKISIGYTEYTTKEYKASLSAIDLSIRCVFIAGLLGSLVGIIMVLNFIHVSTDTTGPNIAVASLTLLYSFIINTVQYGIRSILQKEIIYREND